MNHSPNGFSRWRRVSISALLLVAAAVAFVVVLKTKVFSGPSLGARFEISLPFSTRDLCFDASHDHLFLVHDGIIDVRNLPDGSQATSLENPADRFMRLVCDRQGSTAYCMTEKGNIKRLDLQTYQLFQETSLDPSHLIDLAVTSKRLLIAASGNEGGITVTGIADKGFRLRRKLSWNPGHMAVSADGKFAAFSAQWRPTFQIVTLTDNNDDNMDEQIHQAGKDTWAESVHFCGRSHVLAVGLRISVRGGGSQFGVLLWDCDSNGELGRLRPFPSGGEIYSMTSSDDGQLLVFGFHYDSILICTTNPLRIVKKLSAYDESSIETWRSQQAKKSPSQDPSMWEELPLEPRRYSRSSSVPNLRAAVTRLALSRDRKWLASHAVIGIDDNPGYGEVKVWPLDKILANHE